MNLRSGWRPDGFVAEVSGELPPPDVDGLRSHGSGGMGFLDLVVRRRDGQGQEQFDHGLASGSPLHFADSGDVG